MWRFVWHRLGVDLHTWYGQMNNICDDDFSDGGFTGYVLGMEVAFWLDYQRGLYDPPRGDAFTFVIDSDSSEENDERFGWAGW